MSRPIRVLFATPEAHPLIKAGGLGDVSGALPRALAAAGLDVRVLLPGYRSVLDAFATKGVAEDIHLLPALPPASLVETSVGADPVPIYLLDAPQLFDRAGGPYQDAQGQDWPDNAQRFGALSRMTSLLGGRASPIAWRPDIIHCNDWPTGLAPAYVALNREATPRTVISVHNITFPGAFPASSVPALGLPWSCFDINGVEFHGELSFLKAGLYYADHITTVSPGYAREIQTEAYGGGFHGLLAQRQTQLTGIMNGIDTTEWNPQRDAHISAPYHADALESKDANKRALQERMDLAPEAGVPVVGMVTRLTHQKGIDLLPPAIARFAGEPVQFVILGSGDIVLKENLEQLASELPDQVRVTIGYDEALAHQVIAGADMFLMPSRFEPCGLTQLYSMRYGTPPVVRRTGGLGDSVTDATTGTLSDGTATGFCFEEADDGQLAGALRRALEAYRDPECWRRIQRNAMRNDYGWSRSAVQYKSLYEKLLAQ